MVLAMLVVSVRILGSTNACMVFEFFHNRDWATKGIFTAAHDSLCICVHIKQLKQDFNPTFLVNAMSECSSLGYRNMCLTFEHNLRRKYGQRRAA